MDEIYTETVLRLVEQIPEGRVRSYGDLAEEAGARLGRGGPRQVGTVLAQVGATVPWWRVVTADGRVPTRSRLEALRALRAEGTALRPDGERVDMARARTVGPGCWDGGQPADT